MAKEIRQTSLGLHNVRTHGRSYVGRVLSGKMNATVTVTWERKRYVPKFERYMTQTSKVVAHNPDSIEAKEGDIVRIKQCRPISKTKNFIVIEKLGSTDDVVENISKASKETSALENKSSGAKKTETKKKTSSSSSKSSAKKSK
ncbi:MAG: 30S ribosomal protein S17 [Candidatus Woesearchaeota archaeon]